MPQTSQTYLGCLQNKAEVEITNSGPVEIRIFHGWVLCGYTVRDPITWEPILVLCSSCCRKHGFRW